MYGTKNMKEKDQFHSIVLANKCQYIIIYCCNISIDCHSMSISNMSDFVAVKSNIFINLRAKINRSPSH